MSIRIAAPGKINLYLNITGRREDGYHTMEMVLATVSLCDEVEIALREKGIRFSCDGLGLPAGEENTAYQAARLVLEAAGGGGVSLRLHKRIPTQAGMGGGSADAAAVIFGLNRLLGEPLDWKRQLEIAAQVGADVPFCLTGGIQRATGAGEELMPLGGQLNFNCVLVKPHTGIPTAWAFAQFDRKGAPLESSLDEICQAVRQGDLAEVAALMQNAFEQVCPLEEVSALKRQLLQMGALGAMMTGSGSAVFGLFEDHASALAAAEELEADGLEAWAARSLPEGPWVLSQT